MASVKEKSEIAGKMAAKAKKDVKDICRKVGASKVVKDVALKLLDVTFSQSVCFNAFL